MATCGLLVALDGFARTYAIQGMFIQPGSLPARTGGVVQRLDLAADVGADVGNHPAHLPHWPAAVAVLASAVVAGDRLCRRMDAERRVPSRHDLPRLAFGR